MLKDLISKYRDQLHEHTELRAQVNTNRAVTLVGGNLVTNSRSDQSGVSARMYKNGVYGFASGAEYTDESIRAVLKAAEENALFMDSRVKKIKGHCLKWRRAQLNLIGMLTTRTRSYILTLLVNWTAI